MPGGTRGSTWRRAGKALEVSVPSFFRCPISLDVMKSPVSLCTGVTYDRASIQKWLDAGHNTCPATMQLLHTTDFVPNHTVRRLIQVWCAQAPPRQGLHGTDAPTPAADLLRDLQSCADPLPVLRKLAAVAGEPARIHDLAENADSVPVIGGILDAEEPVLRELELVVNVLAPLLRRRMEKGCEVDRFLGSRPRVLSSLAAVLKGGVPGARVAAAFVIDSIASSGPEAKRLLVETEGLLAELLHLLSDEDGEPAEAAAVDAALSCLVSISSQRRLRPQLVAVGAISATGKLLRRHATKPSAAEKALRLMEAASACAEGRAAICESPDTVAAVVGTMLKVSPAATEHAAVVLWSVCHLFRDTRAQEAVLANNGVTKVLLLMQSNCSAAARAMAGDLLRVFGIGGKSCLPACDFKTSHIMPF